MAIMLVKLLGLEGTPQNNFSDVRNDKYYANYVALAKQYGIVNGSNGNFNPESHISRQDAMVMVAQVLEGLGIDTTGTETKSLSQFSDSENFSDYARKSANILLNTGIISGNDGKLNPTSAITRAEITTMISNVYDILETNISHQNKDIAE